MTKSKLSFKDNSVSVGGRSWEVEFPVVDAKVIDDRVVLIFDQMAGPTWCQFQNLKAYDFNGNELWTAQHPTNTTSDSYVSFRDEVKESTFLAWNFACYVCEIEIETGKLIESTFTK